MASALYVKGSIALDLGSQEYVTVSTAIPSDIGDSAQLAIDQVNIALANLSGTLATLKSEIKAAFQDAITTVETTINDKVDDIVAQVKSLIEQGISEVSSIMDDVSGDLDSATSGLSLDSLIAPIIDGITGSIPDPLKGIVQELVSSISSKLGDAFDSLISDMLGKIMDRNSSAAASAVQKIE
ncbi:MAG: hypothetical protein P8Z33_14440, partial [Gammaproteobacteria bacterium]